MTTGERIKALRKSLGLTQEELGKRIGVQKAAINKYETGIVVNLKQSTIQALSKALHVSPVYLLNGDESVSSSEDGSNDLPKNEKVRGLVRILNRMSPDKIDQVESLLLALYAKTCPELFDDHGAI